MPSIALFTEGITDQIVLESLIFNFLKIKKYNDLDELNVNCIQPTRDATDENKQANFGGWENIFEYCKQKEVIEAAISMNDFILIQIDTDCAEHINFGVSRTNAEGKEKDTSEIVLDVSKRIESLIDAAIIEAYRDRFIFAISVHSLECWILHFLGDMAKKSQHNCTERVINVFNRRDEKYCKNAAFYKKIANIIKKEKNVKIYEESDESLSIFIKKIDCLFKNVMDSGVGNSA